MVSTTRDSRDAYAALAELRKQQTKLNKKRRTKLQTFAKAKFKNSKKKNKCAILIQVIEESIKLANTVGIAQANPAQAVIGDLKAVVIGDGYLIGRSKGPYLAGHTAGAIGFKPEMRDNYNQIQHAMAGLCIAFEHVRPLQWYVQWGEDEDQDKKLYEASFAVGNWLFWNPKQLKKLPVKMRAAIGDSTCVP